MKWLLLPAVVLMPAHDAVFAQVKFTKITDGLVINDNRYSEGSAWGDINNDGYLDLFVPDAWEDKSNLLFLNNGDGSFAPLEDDPVVTDISTSSGGSFGDFDNDGHLDLFVQNYFGRNNHLYLNNGDGTFSKVTSGAIVEDAGFSFNSSLTDFNSDGNLDVFVDNGAFTEQGENNFFYRGNGDGTFTKVVGGHIVDAREKSLSSGWCDYDNDGDLDLYVANGDPFNYVGIDNFFYRNDSTGTLTSVTEGVVVNDGGASTGVSWADYDNDGDFDLFVANWGGEKNFLYQNNGDGTFTKITSGPVVNDRNHSVGGCWADFDNDGDLDLYVANDLNEKNCFYLNNGNGTFGKVYKGDFVNDTGRSNGATAADYDNDGYLDLFVPNGARPSQSNCLYHNDTTSDNNWINIKCVGTISNTSAIGTRVWAKATINDRPVWQLRQVSSQTGFNAQNSLNVEFGFGDAAAIDSLIFAWLSGGTETYTAIQTNMFYTAIEGEGLFELETAVERKQTQHKSTDGLFQNYPNPFNETTVIAFRLTEPGSLAIKVYDSLGREVRTVAHGHYGPGRYSIRFDGTDDSGESLPSGVYLFRFEAPGSVITRKLLFLR